MDKPLQRSALSIILECSVVHTSFIPQSFLRAPWTSPFSARLSPFRTQRCTHLVSPSPSSGRHGKAPSALGSLHYFRMQRSTTQHLVSPSPSSGHHGKAPSALGSLHYFRMQRCTHLVSPSPSSGHHRKAPSALGSLHYFRMQRSTHNIFYPPVLPQGTIEKPLQRYQARQSPLTGPPAHDLPPTLARYWATRRSYFATSSSRAWPLALWSGEIPEGPYRCPSPACQIGRGKCLFDVQRRVDRFPLLVSGVVFTCEPRGVFFSNSTD